MEGIGIGEINLNFFSEFVSTLTDSGLLQKIILWGVGLYAFWQVILFIRKLVDKHS